MNVPTNLKYTASHEWIRSESDGTLTIGITPVQVTVAIRLQCFVRMPVNR